MGKAAEKQSAVFSYCLLSGRYYDENHTKAKLLPDMLHHIGLRSIGIGPTKVDNIYKPGTR